MALVRPKPNDTGDRAAVQAPSTSDSEARGLGAPAAAPAGRGLAAAGAPPSSAGAKVAPRTAAPHVASRPIPTLRTAAPAQPVTPRDESAVLDLLNRQLWDQARTALHQLAARDPASKKIRALACYARGREAQLDGRVDDARVELQDALELDPDLQLAKTALTELFTRRK
jgi:tetratricopeptide (TPR) repeat protein